MTAGLNTNLQAILSQAKMTCSNIFASPSAFGGSDYATSIFNLISEGENAINGGDEQKAQAITNMVQNLLSMLTSISNEKEKAAQDANKNSKDADNVDNKAKQTANETKTDIKELLKSIGTNEAAIQSALDDIKALSGEDGEGGELKVQKEKLEKILAEIETQKAIVNDGVSNLETKRAALEKIQSLSGEIAELVSQISEIEKSLNSLNNVVETSAKNVENLTQESANVIENGSEKLANHMQEATAQIGKNTADSAKGTAEETAGATLTAKGGATSFIPIIGQTASAKAIQVGLDLIAAGGIRISGSASNISKLTTAIGQMGKEFTEFGGALDNVIGSATKTTELIGQYGTILEPTITSIGSWATVADANGELNEAIADANAKLGNTNDKPQTQNNNNNWSSFAQNNTSFNVQENQQQASSEQGQILNFDIKKFGI